MAGAWDRALVPAREEDRQTTLEAAGHHDTQPVKQEKLSVLQVLEGRAASARGSVAHGTRLQARMPGVHRGGTEVVDTEGVFPDGQTDKPDDDSVSHQPARGHVRLDGREEQVDSSVHSEPSL